MLYLMIKLSSINLLHRCSLGHILQPVNRLYSSSYTASQYITKYSSRMTTYLIMIFNPYRFITRDMVKAGKNISDLITNKTQANQLARSTYNLFNNVLQAHVITDLQNNKNQSLIASTIPYVLTMTLVM
jgi:hypothetical protein